jgi:hypothetical protein
MWVILSLLSLLVAILVPAALHDLKVRRRSRQARIATPYAYKDHRQQPWMEQTMSGVYNTPGGANGGLPVGGFGGYGGGAGGG